MPLSPLPAAMVALNTKSVRSGIVGVAASLGGVVSAASGQITPAPGVRQRAVSSTERLALS